MLLELTEPWHHSGVTANAYFALVEAALAMKEKGLTAPYLHWQREAVQQAVSYGIPWEYNTPTTRITSGPRVN